MYQLSILTGSTSSIFPVGRLVCDPHSDGNSISQSGWFPSIHLDVARFGLYYETRSFNNISKINNYLHQGGYGFICISLFVSRITQKLLDQCSQKLV